MSIVAEGSKGLVVWEKTTKSYAIDGWHLKNVTQTLQAALVDPKTWSYFCPAWSHSQPWHWPPQGFCFCLSFCLYFTFRFSLNWHRLVSPPPAAPTQGLHGACRSYPNFIPAKQQIYFTQPALINYQGIICPFPCQSLMILGSGCDSLTAPGILQPSFHWVLGPVQHHWSFTSKVHPASKIHQH